MVIFGSEGRSEQRGQGGDGTIHQSFQAWLNDMQYQRTSLIFWRGIHDRNFQKDRSISEHVNA
jgi:hypothetical protein